MISYTLYIIPIRISKGTIITVGYRDAQITIYTIVEGARKCTFTKVLYIPEISTNLLSTELLREKGVFYRSDRQQLFIIYTDKVDVILVDVYLYNRLPYLVIEALVIALVLLKIVTKPKASILV